MACVFRRRFAGFATAGLAIAVGISVHASRPVSSEEAAAVSATFTVLKSFAGGSDGAYPVAGLAQSTDGNLYGTTSGLVPGGGTSGSGTVFKVTSGGTATVLHAFSPCTDAASAPATPVIPGFDGNLYGTTATTCAGGAAFYKVTPAGAVTVVHTFNAATEGSGRIVLAQASDGSFYGTA